LHASERRVVWGVSLKDAAEGTAVNAVSADSPGAKAGIKVGDVLLNLDGIAVSSSAMVPDVLQSHSPDDTVVAKIQRAGKEIALRVTLAGETTRAALERALDPYRFIRQNVWTRP